MKKSIFTFSTLFALSTGVVFSQQEKLLTHFIYDKMSINPGATGIDFAGITATGVYRNQWDKVNGAPNSALFNVEADINKSAIPGGVGVSFYHDAIGEMKQNNLLLNYSFHLPVQINGAYQGILGAGIGLGFTSIGFDPQWIPPTTINDPLLPISTKGGTMDFNFGLYWKGIKNAMRPYYVGFSITHLNQGAITNNINYTNAKHMFLIGGYKMIDVLGTGRSLDFQMLTRTDLVKYSAELNSRYIHSLGGSTNLDVYGGLTYRVSDGVGIMLGAQKPNWVAGYSYDMTLNKLRTISKGSHEIVFRYLIPLPEPPVQKAKHPRWL